MRAIILAGGKGTRLRPLTAAFPKPLMPLDDVPILEVLLRQLARQGFDHITLAVGHLAGLIEAFFGDGESLGLKIDYSLEQNALGTVGPLSLINDLPENFLVMNGDVLTLLDYQAFIKSHIEGGNIASVAAYKRSVKIDFGVLELNDDCEIIDYTEKPELPYQVSMGVYAFNKRVLNHLHTGEYRDFPDLVHMLLEAGEKVIAHPYDGFWLDIGRHDDYNVALQEFQDRRIEFLGD